MSKTEVITARVDGELSSWLREKALAKKCKINDVIKEAILAYKQLEDLPGNLQFSDSILTQGAKAAMVVSRLLINFMGTVEGGDKLVASAIEFAKTDFELHRIKTSIIQDEELGKQVTD